MVTENKKQVLKQSLCEAVQEIGMQGWCQGTGGNFSVTVSHDPIRLLITQSGKHKRKVQEDDIILVGGTGRRIVGEKGKPSAETLLHCAIVEIMNAGAVFHTHSVWNTLLGEHFQFQDGFHLHGYEMLKGLSGIQSHEDKVYVPILENSQDMESLTEKTRSMLTYRPSLNGFLLAGHGLYTWGKNINEALRHVEIFEFLFECVGRRTTFSPYSE